MCVLNQHFLLTFSENPFGVIVLDTKSAPPPPPSDFFCERLFFFYAFTICPCWVIDHNWSPLPLNLPWECSCILACRPITVRDLSMLTPKLEWEIKKWFVSSVWQQLNSWGINWRLVTVMYCSEICLQKVICLFCLFFFRSVRYLKM